jgi:competence protein ComEC
MRDALANWIETERDRFPLLLPIAMGAAILAYFALPAEPKLWLAALLPAGALAALAISWRHLAARLIAALLLAAALGFTRAELRTAAQPPLIIVPVGAIGVSGTIAGIDLLPDSRRITLIHARLDSAPPVTRAIRLRLRPDDPTPLTPGETVQAYAMLFGPERPAYPGAWDAGRQDFFAGLALQLHFY